jgi:hypothetical protein
MSAHSVLSLACPLPVSSKAVSWSQGVLVLPCIDATANGRFLVSGEDYRPTTGRRTTC